MLTADQSYEGVQNGYPGEDTDDDDDDMWRAFLESPLTAATKAMMSMNGDDEASGALGMLYDYYKIPRNKKAGSHFKTESTSSGEAEPSKTNSSSSSHTSSFLVPYQDSLLTMTPLTNVSLHTVVQASGPPPAKRGGSLHHPHPHAYPEPPVPPPPYSDALHSLPQVSVGAPPPPSQTPGPRGSQAPSPPLGYRPSLGGHGGCSPDSLTPDSTHQGFALPENLRMHQGSGVSSDDLPLDSSTGSGQRRAMFQADHDPAKRPRHDESNRVALLCLCYVNEKYDIPLDRFGNVYKRCKKGMLLNVDDNIIQHCSNEDTFQIHMEEVGGQSVVMLVFGEDKAYEDQLKHWKFWQTRQHTAKQRCLDIADYKESFKMISNMEETAYNAVSFTWDCRSEARKGVRGLPLNLQVDTYAVGRHGDRLVHRAISQVKVFCDKGAERKIRDEERKQNRRKGKGAVTADATAARCCSTSTTTSSSTAPNEDTFQIHMEEVGGQVVLTLTEI
ncbi:hypothetical protein CRUP_027977 [Coryphaenoides rupestris]|nr:hypothetical protein CRUP_027977 [Coryphaenoides rupestris]